MKKNIYTKTISGICLIAICLLIVSLFITGCSNSETENSTVQPQSTQDTTISGDLATEKPLQNQSPIITREEANKKALAHAGVLAENAQRFESRLEWEDGRQVYEIEFDYQGLEYDYEVDAKTGEILHFSKEPR